MKNREPGFGIVSSPAKQLLSEQAVSETHVCPSLWIKFSFRSRIMPKAQHSVETHLQNRSSFEGTVFGSSTEKEYE